MARAMRGADAVVAFRTKGRAQCPLLAVSGRSLTVNIHVATYLGEKNQEDRPRPDDLLLFWTAH